MKYSNHICLVLLFLPMILLSQTKRSIEIKNSTNANRDEVVVAIKWETIMASYPKIDTANFIVINSLTNKQIPYQLEHKGLPEIQNLLVLVSAKAKETLRLFIEKGKPAVFKTKTYARYVPERLDDFAWENDKIAFRAYGKALEKTKDDAYGLDVWVKRTDKMVLNERYKRDEYHIDHGDGLDYYKVGFTLGAGSMAPFIKDSVCYSGNYHRWKLLDNGPLRSSFALEYDTWDAFGVKVSCTRTISLDAGSQLNRIENVYKYTNESVLPVVVGISKRPENGIISLNEQQGILGYWEPRHGDDGTTGVGSILTTKTTKMLVKSDQVLAVTATNKNEPIVYYTGAVWDKAGKITNATQWFDYLNHFSEELKNPLVVKVN